MTEVRLKKKIPGLFGNFSQMADLKDSKGFGNFVIIRNSLVSGTCTQSWPLGMLQLFVLFIVIVIGQHMLARRYVSLIYCQNNILGMLQLLDLHISLSYPGALSSQYFSIICSSGNC